MNPYDAAALFWYSRNKHYFWPEIQDNERVLPVKYEDLVTKPSSVMRRIYQHIGAPYPGDYLVAQVKTTSVGEGASVTHKISKPVSRLCDTLLDQLDSAYKGLRAL